MKPLALCLLLTGCTTIYKDGKPTLRTSGDITYERKADGSEKLTANHSAIIREYGTAGAKIGASVTAIKLIP